MPVSTDIKLKRDAEPIWRDRCICCGKDSPGHTVTIATTSVGWWTLAFWSFGKWFSVKVPACRGCGRKLKAVRWFRYVIGVGAAFLGVAIAMWLLKFYQGPMRKVLAMVVALIAMIPYFILDVIFPQVIDITCFSKTVDYEFRDEKEALWFMSLNGDALVEPDSE